LGKAERIGICGGTFDPIHYGHMVIAEEIREKFFLDKILFIPSGMPPHKVISGVTLPLHRFNMVSSAISKYPFFEASRIEIDRPGFSYTIDTLTELRELFGQDTGLFFIIGADVIFELHAWRSIDKVFRMFEFIAVLRPGYEEEKFIKEVEYLNVKFNAKISIAEASSVDISSSGIRDRVRNNISIKQLVPECVEEYIYKHGLYK
jgi:nicotinate-nucleotide adenylyltransferase